MNDLNSQLPTQEEYPESSKLKRFKAICSDNENGEMSFSNVTLTEDHLIILCECEANRVFVINLVSTAKFPIRLAYYELLKKIDEGEVLLVDHEFDPKTFKQDDDLPASVIKRKDERYDAILPLIEDLDSSLANGYGQGAFKDAADRAGRKVQFIYNTFYSYLRHGCRKSGLVMPQGKDANHTPKKRDIRVKQGRVSKDVQGKVLEEDDYKAFNWAKREYSKGGMTIEKVVSLMYAKFYFETRSLLSEPEQKRLGKKFNIKLKPAHLRPTEHQFHYWLNKQHNGVLPRRDKKQNDALEYQSDIAGRKGNGNTWVIGPGQTYQLDETPFDEELVSTFDPHRRLKIGKATLYFVKDVFSRCVVGLYITTQPPSYDTVKEAVFNSFREKSGLLKELQLPFDPVHFPQSGVPTGLFVDRAEFHNKLSEGPITSDVPITVKFTRTGRGDDKGMIEKMFDTYSMFFKGLSPAHQTKKRRDIQKQIARKNACLTIDELYEIAVVYIIFYNNFHEIEDYPACREMKVDGVPPIPAKIWDWGMKYRPGYLQDVPEHQLYLDLLEVKDVTVYQDHVYLLGTKLKYTCEWTLKMGYQDWQKGSKQKTFKARVHRGCVDFIYLVTEEGLQVAILHNDHQAFIGCSFEEVKIQLEVERRSENSRKQEALERKLETMYVLKERVRTAIAEKLPAHMQDTHELRNNRTFDSMFAHQLQVNRLYHATKDSFYSEQQTITNNENDEESDTYDDFDI
ncbi:hypothetical protein [Alteromonas australica]|uniref:hypothetical protein n=1 Tax=Alteromonas australica TaxID=589873 RepID=UPI0035C83027